MGSGDIVNYKLRKISAKNEMLGYKAEMIEKRANFFEEFGYDLFFSGLPFIAAGASMKSSALWIPGLVMSCSGWLMCWDNEIDSGRSNFLKMRIEKEKRPKPEGVLNQLKYHILPSHDINVKRNEESPKFFNFRSLEEKWEKYRASRYEFLDSRSKYIDTRREYLQKKREAGLKPWHYVKIPKTYSFVIE